MTINLPDLSGASCRHFIACGTMVDPDAATQKWLKKNQMFEIAKTKSHASVVFVRAVVGRPFDDHCHIDVATPEFFKEMAPPKASKPWAAIQKMVSPLMGKELTVEVEGIFAAPADRLPMAIRMASIFDSVQGGVGIKMTGGRFSVTGAPIYAISWRLDDSSSEKEATIRLEAKIPTKLDEDYLIRAFDVVRSGFESFIESGVPHGGE